MKFFIDGMEVHALSDDTIMDAAKREGIFIPGFCYSQQVEVTSCCRLCMVEIREGGRVKTVAACAFKAREGLEVITKSDKITKVRSTLLKLMYAQAPENSAITELMEWCGVLPDERIPKKEGQCILCGLCTGACSKMGIRAISAINRGVSKKVDTPYGRAAEVCVGCGSCAEICPTNCITVEDDDSGRRMWNKDFAWQRCTQCGEVISTLEHWQAAIPPDAPILCPKCRKRAITGVLAFTYGE